MTAASGKRARPVAPASTDLAIKAMADGIAAQVSAMSADHDKAATGDVEAIHRLRVATRRLRAALRVLRAVAPGEEVENTTEELSWLGGAIGEVRDLDVLAQLLETRAARLEPDFVRSLAAIFDSVRRQREVEQERLRAALNSERYLGLMKRLGAIAPEPNSGGIVLGAIAARVIRPQLRAMLRTGAGLDEASPPENMHRLRVRAKKLRYALEPMRAVGGKPARKMLRRLQRVQERVGMYHDVFAAIAWLRGWAQDGHDARPATMMAVGALIQSLERRLRRLRGRSLKAWRRGNMDELARALLHELNYSAGQARRSMKPPLNLVSELPAS